MNLCYILLLCLYISIKQVCRCFQAKDAKACLRLDSINITVVPEKVGNPNGMQINFEHDEQVRNLFVYAETPQVTQLPSAFICLVYATFGLYTVNHKNVTFYF